MAKSQDRIIRDPSGPATVSRETLRAAAKKVWDDKRSSSSREAIQPHQGDARYVRRDDDGRMKENDIGRSLRKDVQQPAKTTVPPGQGDKGDQKRDTSRFANAPALKPNKK